jgi:hypothetical protein
MSLLNLKPRPIPSRDKDPDRLRDDRLFILACDDTYAPKQYFDFFQSKFPRVRIHVVETTNGTSVAGEVLKRLLEYEHEDYDELWMVLDTDHLTQGSHLRGLTRALKDAQKKGVQVALSKPCFELWLLMHHVDETALDNFPDATAVGVVLNTQLGGYNKTNLKKNHFPISSVALACKRAERLDIGVAGGMIPNANTSRVYLIWKSIVEKALPLQIPVELQGLLPQMKQGAPDQM